MAVDRSGLTFDGVPKLKSQMGPILVPGHLRLVGRLNCGAHNAELQLLVRLQVACGLRARYPGVQRSWGSIRLVTVVPLRSVASPRS